MTTVLLIIVACVAVAYGVTKLVKALSYKEQEENLPIENPEVAKPTVKKQPRKPRAKKTTK